ncbi:MAG: transcription termination factor NusA [Clostridia bacterium]
MVNKEFFAALDVLEKEKKISRDKLLEALEAGIVFAYKKETGETRQVTVRIDEDRYTIKIFAYRQVVEEVLDEDKEISVEDARALKASYKIGDVVLEDITPKQFSRIAAQTAKQVIMQRLNDARRDIVMNEMTQREGEILSAIVRKKEGTNIFVDITGNQMEGILALADQVPTERLEINDVIKVYIKKVRTTNFGAQVVVSRSAAGFVKRLFELEVPEIRGGLVKINGIVREAGYRTKIAVSSDDSSVDAIGACIGQKGARVNAIVAELNGEKIDVIAYCVDPLEYVSRALSPAPVHMVQINAQEKSARVVVADEKLSLAIGKQGQNARLAAKLTGWKIDVKPLSSVMRELNSDEEKPVSDTSVEVKENV